MIKNTFSRLGLLAACTVAAGWLAGCGSTGSTVPGQISDATAPREAVAAAEPAGSSRARTPREYRQDAARHVYARNADRIYAGKLPPMLYAIGVLEVKLDARGQVTGMHWLRAPKHAPDAIAGIERTVLAAAPYPVATRLGSVVWTDTWLWDRSGRFQLDTLSEGQLQQ